MNAEIINTGSELMFGRVLNTHQQWLSRQLSDRGYTVKRQLTVADTGEEIELAVRESLSRADAVITTGGLGPTSDDITRERIAALLKRPLREDAGTLTAMEKFFAARKRHMPARNRVQALVPEGARVLENPHGTAPGLALELSPNPFRGDGKSSWLIMLPGPPRELRPMFTNIVAPLLQEKFPPEAETVSRTLRTIGIGESLLEEKIAPSLATLVARGLELGYCAQTWQVDVRLAASGTQAGPIVNEAEKVIQERLGRFIFADGDQSLESVLVRLLTERKQTLALAESCTGGGIANRITNVPGASVVFLAGLVTYSNEAKQSLLDVRLETLAQHGAVSEATAREMADGARQRTGASYALSVTGIAGPDGGTVEKPVGTVFIGLAAPTTLTAEHFFNPFDRETFKVATANQALESLRRALLNIS